MRADLKGQSKSLPQTADDNRLMRFWFARLVNRILPAGLSPRLLVLTVLFVLLSEVLIYLPSVVEYRHDILLRRVEAAQLAALSLEAAEDNNITLDLTEELLANAEVVSVILKRDERRSLFLSPDQMPPMPEERFDLAHDGFGAQLLATFQILFRTHDRLISVRDVPRLKGGLSIEAVMPEAPIRKAILAYSVNILGLSVAISILTAGLVFAAIHILLVRPMQRIERSMIGFRSHPEDAGVIIRPSERRDEVGSAERELALMQSQLRAALNQRTRLAALGTAVAQINHDLRNILASAQLIVDRLELSEDPKVRQMAPKLVSAIDRAVNLCTNTMRYGRADERPPLLEQLDLHRLAEDVIAAAAPPGGISVHFRNEVPPGFAVTADNEHLFRILLNLCRNAVQAIQRTDRPGQVTLSAARGAGEIHIDVADTGPGVPGRARESLFQPFGVSENRAGAGLGLSIAAELARGQGGTLDLVETGPEGTRFRLTLPDRRRQLTA